MKKLNTYLLSLCCGALLIGTSCTERFRPELTGFQNSLIVDGNITNEAGPYTIRLSLSSDLGAVEYKPRRNAVVTIVEENGVSETLVETAAGVYQTSETGIQGKVNRRYKLQIETAEGRSYESTYQTLKAPTPIVDVYAAVESKFFTESNSDVMGYQFYVDAAESPNEQDYFLWLTDETFKYSVEHEIQFIFPAIPFPNPDSLQTCWRKDTVSDITTYDTGAFANPEVKNIPLHFVKSTDLELSFRYSPLVKQYTISEEAYVFWQAIEAQLQLDAPLYSAQPYQTRGNITNVNDKEETVLGFFLVAGVSEKRIFVDAPTDLQLFDIECFFEYESYGFALGQPAAYAEFYPTFVGADQDGNRGFLPIECLDCRSHGGSIVEPDYWED